MNYSDFDRMRSIEVYSAKLRHDLLVATAELTKKTELIRALDAELAKKAELVLTLDGEVAEKAELTRALGEELAQKAEIIRILDEESAQKAERIRTLTAHLIEVTSDQFRAVEKEKDCLRAVAQCKRRRYRLVLPKQLKGVSKFFKKRKRRLWRNYLLIAVSPLFDADWYLKQNSDVKAAGVDPVLHFLLNGSHERRQPGPLFDAIRYVTENPDIAKDNHNPLVHFLRWGALERRPLGLPVPICSLQDLEGGNAQRHETADCAGSAFG